MSVLIIFLLLFKKAVNKQQMMDVAIKLNVVSLTAQWCIMNNFNKNRMKIKEYFKQLFCKHDWEYEYWTNGIIKTCKKCGKVKRM